MTEKSDSIIPIERIQQCIYLIRKHKVMLDADLAELYAIETGALVRAVKRNKERFPEDFMFQLTKTEYEIYMKCQTGISKNGRGGRRYLPYVFTEQGVAMLSSVLRSNRAVEVNIAIMRTFVKLREIIADNSLLRRKIESMERRYDEKFEVIFETLSAMLAEENGPKIKFGFHSRKTKNRKSGNKNMRK
jgi:hypothetical protein